MEGRAITMRKGILTIILGIWLVLGVVLPQPVLAGLPSADKQGQIALENKNLATRGDYISVVEGYLAQGGKVLALAISVLGFLWVAYSALAKFNQCRIGKAEWSELGLLVVAASVLLVFVTLLLTQSEGILKNFADEKTGNPAILKQQAAVAKEKAEYKRFMAWRDMSKRIRKVDKKGKLAPPMTVRKNAKDESWDFKEYAEYDREEHYKKMEREGIIMPPRGRK